MDTAANNIFPFIFETLSQKARNEETQTNLLEDIRLQMKNEGLKITNLKKKYEEALDIGEELGILQRIQTNVRLPFSNRSKSLNSKKETMPTIDKERRSRRRRSSSRRSRQSRSRSGSRRRSQRRRSRRGSRK